MKTIQISEYTCLVGQNALENWTILSEAASTHLLFHLTSFPSCFVILSTETILIDCQNSDSTSHHGVTIESVSQDAIVECAKICIQHTKYKNRKNVLVDYTPVSNVRKGEVPGEIYYIHKKKVQTVCI